MTAKWTAENDAQAHVQGWGIFEIDSGNTQERAQLQKCDSSEIFEDDAEAWAHVAKGAKDGDPLCIAALAYLAENAPSELKSIHDANT